MTRTATRAPSKMGLTFPLVGLAEDVWLDELDEDDSPLELDELLELLEPLEVLELDDEDVLATVTDTMLEVTFSGVWEESVTVRSKYQVPGEERAPVDVEGLEGAVDVKGVPRLTQPPPGASSSH